MQAKTTGLPKAALLAALMLALVLSLTLALSPPAAVGQDPPPANEVGVSFGTGQTYNTEEDFVDNSFKNEPLWINAWLDNRGNDNHESVVSPILALHVAPVNENGRVTGVDQQQYLHVPWELPGTDFQWDFPDIPEYQQQHAYAEFKGLASDFQPGFVALREVNSTTFPYTEETQYQYLTLTVTPQESMQVLVVNGTTEVGGPDIASVTDVTFVSSKPKLDYEMGELPNGMTIDHNEHGFSIGVKDPAVSTTYQWLVTIEVHSQDSPLDMEFMPFVQVQNMVAVTEQPPELAKSSLSYDSSLGDSPPYTPYEWKWQADGTYNWNWDTRQLKEANLKGCARVSANALATEGHFHLSTPDNVRLNVDEETQEVLEVVDSPLLGNLFTFTHPSTPSRAQVKSWSYVHTLKPSNTGDISGSFVMAVHRDQGGGEEHFDFGTIDGTIAVEFKASSYAVLDLIYPEAEPIHYNFAGNFEITEGTGFYEGIKGSGTIGGTFHDHSWSGPANDSEKWFDFVMMGEFKF